MNKEDIQLLDEAMTDEIVSMLKKHPPKKGIINIPLLDLLYLGPNIYNRILKRIS